MKTTVKKIALIMLIALFVLAVLSFLALGMNGSRLGAAYAADEEVAQTTVDAETQLKQTKAITASVIIVVAAAVGAVSMMFVICKTIEGISRQPEAEGKIRTAMMLGLVFIETLAIYALIVAIMVIFVL